MSEEGPLFLYHGTSELVNVLRPRKPHGLFRASDQQAGVYATPNMKLAIAFALGPVPDVQNRMLWTVVCGSGGRVKIVFYYGHPSFGKKGYVYRVATEGFKEISPNQWVSKKSVRPLEVIEIAVDNYLHMVRYASENERKKILQKSTNTEPAPPSERDFQRRDDG
jgi:hypothetical protein